MCLPLDAEPLGHLWVCPVTPSIMCRAPRPSVKLLTVAGISLWYVLSSAVGGGNAAKMFRWVDENVVVHYTDQIPANQVAKGYAELSNQGVRVEVVPPA